MMDKFSFQYCQKIVVFSKDNSKVLLARRKGEADYDEVYSFIGGKMETTDQNVIEGMRREKNEEVGEDFVIRLNTKFNLAVNYVKKDGSAMILPHYYAQHLRGEITLNEEYSEYKWVLVSEIDTFSPMVENIPEKVKELLRLLPIMKDADFIEL